MAVFLAEALQEIPNVWTLLGLCAVLGHQTAMMIWQTRAHRSNTGELEAIKAELTECRARWDSVQNELHRLQLIVQTLARGIGREPDPPPS